MSPGDPYGNAPMESSRRRSLASMHEFPILRAAAIAHDRERRGAGPDGRSAIRAWALLAAAVAAPLTAAAAAAPMTVFAARRGAETSQRIDELHATVTDRGLILHLRDVRFIGGTAALQRGATDGLDWLVAFLQRYPCHTVLIEGYSGRRGSRAIEHNLSALRAHAVLAYLRRRGILAARFAVAGEASAQRIASHEPATGRRSDRRVEVVIDDAAVASGLDQRAERMVPKGTGDTEVTLPR